MGDKSFTEAVCGLGLGDEGKGSFVDAWVGRMQTPALVVRYNGGPQAAHHVVLPDGRWHCFAQLGAGMLQNQTETLLSPYMLVEPLSLVREATHLAELGVGTPLLRTWVARRCVVVTPFHKLLGRLREVARGNARHGSCGLGVSQAWLDSQKPGLPSLRIDDLLDPGTLCSKLRFLQLVKVDQAEQLLDSLPPQQRTADAQRLLTELQHRDVPQKLADDYARFVTSGVHFVDDQQVQSMIAKPQRPCILEGAQGVLLDAEHGFFPFVTPSKTSLFQANLLLNGRPSRQVGIVRAYATRHGPGPLVSEDAELTRVLRETHNVENPWQGPMRVGWFDAVATRYALAVVSGQVHIALTCLDRLVGLSSLYLCNRYRYDGPWAADLDDFFVFDAARHVSDLRRAAQPTLARQQRLTELLAHCRPILQTLAPIPTLLQAKGSLSTAADAYIDALLAAIKLDRNALICLSVGDKASDKRWFD